MEQARPGEGDGFPIGVGNDGIDGVGCSAGDEWWACAVDSSRGLGMTGESGVVGVRVPTGGTPTGEGGLVLPLLLEIPTDGGCICLR